MANGSDLAEALSDSVNSGINPDELTEVLSNEHRYLQSEVFKQVVKPIILEYARMAEKKTYDARNEQALKEAKEIADAMGWSY